MSQRKSIAELKALYIRYYADAPVQKYAAMYINRDEDTTIRWKDADTQFADAVQRAKAEFIRKLILRTKSEFILERLESEIFGRKKADVDITIKAPAPIVYLPADLPQENIAPIEPNNNSH